MKDKIIAQQNKKAVLEERLKTKRKMTYTLTQKPKLKQKTDRLVPVSPPDPIRFAQRGFKRVDPKILEQKRRRLIIDTFQWSAKKVRRAMAVVNGLVWAIAKANGAVEYGEKGKKIVNRSAIQRLIHQGVRVFKTSIAGLTKYVSENWQGTVCSATSIRLIRNELAELGLFKVSGCKKQSFAWTSLLDVDFMGLLILQEALESAWLKVHFKTLEDLPPHKGGFVRLCWNAAKHVLGREFNRVYGAKIKPPKENKADFDAVNRKKKFVPVYLEGGVELNIDRCDRNGVYYHPGWLDEQSRLKDVEKEVQRRLESGEEISDELKMKFIWADLQKPAEEFQNESN